MGIAGPFGQYNKRLPMQVRIAPSKALGGAIRLPGDKSISHRYAILSAIAEGTSTLKNFSSGADPHSTLGCMQSLGIVVEKNEGEVKVHGRGLRGLQAPAGRLDAGNSGSTIRMLSGVLAGQLGQQGDFRRSDQPPRLEDQLTILHGSTTLTNVGSWLEDCFRQNGHSFGCRIECGALYRNDRICSLGHRRPGHDSGCGSRTHRVLRHLSSGNLFHHKERSTAVAIIGCSECVTIDQRLVEGRRIEIADDIISQCLAMGFQQ